MAAGGPAVQGQRPAGLHAAVPEISIQEIRAPRLIASEPRIDADAVALPLLLPASSPMPGEAVSKAPPTDPVETGPTAYDRITALAAIPLSQPGESISPSHGSSGKAAPWSAQLRGYAVDFWRQIGLGLALLTTILLLMLRIGERGRHAEQELVLEAAPPLSAPDAPAQVVADDPAPLPAVPAGETSRAISPPADWGMVPEDDDNRLRALLFAAGPASTGPSGSAAAPDPARIAPAARQHPRLRDAIEAVKADMATAPEPKAALSA
jgi:hypothetical protein